MATNSGTSLLPTSDDNGQGNKRVSTAAPPKIRRRNRMITSCLECRRRKLKCDKLHPCTNCTKFSRDCAFLAPTLDSQSQKKLTEIKEKMGSLERTLQQDVARRDRARRAKASDNQDLSTKLPGQEDTSSDDGVVPDDEKGLEMTPLAVADAAYENDADDEMLDLGVRVGKMRMTERLGGFFRPKLSEELARMIRDPGNDHRNSEEKAARLPMTPQSTESFLEPGPTYLAPNSSFILGDVGRRRSLMDFLPPKEAADSLVGHYFHRVHTIAKVVHRSTFQLQYDNFWTNVLMGIEPAASAQALVFAVLFAAAVSLSEAEISSIFSRSKRAVVTNFQTGTEVALGKAQFLRTSRIETLQALVIYLIPMCRSEISRAHSVLVGTAIRLGECMGLHRDPGMTYNMPAIECQTRRTLWFQLCLLDLRTVEAQGPRPGIRRDEYDTQFPLNIDDGDLVLAEPKETERAWTDMTFSRMRFECNEMHRVIWVDRLRLEKKQISITHVMGKIESFRRAMEAKYLPIFDERVPIQRLAKLVMDILLLRMHIMVLHRYHNSVTTRIPDRLRQVILTSGTQQMEDAVAVETDPELAPWRWYAGAYQQWQTAFLLLVEVFVYPMRREADRIWNIIDYVFEPDRSLSRTQKGRMLMSEFRDRIAIYRDIRKVRAPVTMPTKMVHTVLRKVDDDAPSNPLNKPRDLKPTAVADSKPNSHPFTPASTSPPETSQGVSPPALGSEGSFHAWSYDTPVNFFVGDTRAPRPWDGSSSSSRGVWWANADKRQEPAAVVSPPSGMGSSPSEVSTTDSWPPFISNQQQGWPAPYPHHSGMETMTRMTNETAVPNNQAEGLIVSGSLAVIDDPVGNQQMTSTVASRAPTAPADPMVLDIDWVSFACSVSTWLQ